MTPARRSPSCAGCSTRTPPDGPAAHGQRAARGNKWLASVPRVDDPTKRHEYTFDTEQEAWEWVRNSLDRLDRGLAPEPPVRRSAATKVVRSSATTPTPDTPRVAARDAEVAWSFEEYARSWHDERYVALHRAQPDRTAEILRDLELHILPLFEDLPADIRGARKALVGWVRTKAGYGEKPGDPIPDGRGYARKTVQGWLWVIGEVLTYAHVLGAPIPMTTGTDGPTPVLTCGIHAIDKRGATKRKPRLVSIEATAEIAAGMHVVHQLGLWIMRIAGLRIAEVYGLLVANVIDDGERGYLLVEALGGRWFTVRDENERERTTHRRLGGKSAAAYRLIALPGALTDLIRLVIAAFHTDPETGHIDGQARLVPPIRSRGGGIAGFRSGLKIAAGERSGASDDPDDYVLPHDLRKAYATDLAWTPDIEALVKRRAMGHRAGSDVFALVYTLDDRLKEHMGPAADAIHREIAAAVPTIVVPTARRPLYGRAFPAERIAYADAVLEAAGWQVRRTGDLVTTREAAAHLGMAESATRRLMNRMIPAVKGADGWLADLDDVLAFRDRLAGYRQLSDVAADAELDYHQCRDTMRRLGVDPCKDAYSGVLLLTDGDADRILDEVDRIRRLRERSMTVKQACGVLRSRHSSVHAWARDGRLVYDDECDGAGTRYVTRQSVREELARRGRTPRAVIPVAEFLLATGIDKAGLASLVERRLVVRARTGFLTRDSVVAWATGHRPDLLDDPLLLTV